MPPSHPPTVAVIPARYGSTRFPGKPLALLAGRPMLQHVHDACLRSGAFARVIVATDDARIEAAARDFGAEVQLTSRDCASGTDRVAEVARRLPDAGVLLNVQGDEPLLAPEALLALSLAFDDDQLEMATLVRPLDPAERSNPHVVKAVLAASGDALYFSRADLPFVREEEAAAEPAPRWAHIGLYGYRRGTLLRVSAMPPSPLERAEKLEQLRALEAGVRVRCIPTEHRSLGVDTPEDLARAERLLRPV